MKLFSNLKRLFVSCYRTGFNVFNNHPNSILFVPVSMFSAMVLTLFTPLLNRFLRSKTYVFNMSAIGHDVADFIEFVHQQEPRISSQRIRFLYRFNSHNPTNNLFLFEIWKRKLVGYDNITIHKTPAIFWCIILYLVQINEFFTRLPNNWLIPLTPNFSTFRSIAKSQITSLITRDEMEEFENLLKQTINTSPGAYCVLGIRDSGFYKDNSIRNSTIEDYVPSIEMLLKLGIPVIRMGRRMLKPIPIEHPLFFDYAFSEHINDRTDIMLWLHARFAFGDASGLTGVVASFGSPLFMPTYTLSPREFISNKYVFFATQSLVKTDGERLRIAEIVALMNAGFALSDERVLNDLNLTSLSNSPIQIRESLQWFLDTALNNSNKGIEYSRVAQFKLLNFLTDNDKDIYSHYRKDVLFSKTWNSMESLIWPKSVDDLMAD